eukprot:TRINITY_DN29087_c0_g1_i1.p1 TRINITY_DN29087_c0_g1~~TRINITY_DN29087_c0_g1_i1.p1  ORF type:complete len:274 (-),score=47.89 TRINITY_DN29087_c0_g1_i1:333-1154(-)
MIPGVVEAENFDVGLPGTMFMDTTPTNNGGNMGYRPDAPAVDIETGNGVDKIMSNNADVNWIAAGEWWRYSVTARIPRATYSASLVAGRATGAVGVSPMALILTVPGNCAASDPLDCEAEYEYGDRKMPSAPALFLAAYFPAGLAQGYYAYQTLVSGGEVVQLDAGQHCLQVCALQEDFHFDSIILEAQQVLATPAPTPGATPQPTPSQLTPSPTSAPDDVSGNPDTSETSTSGSNSMSKGLVVTLAALGSGVGALVVFSGARFISNHRKGRE